MSNTQFTADEFLTQVIEKSKISHIKKSNQIKEKVLANLSNQLVGNNDYIVKNLIENQSLIKDSINNIMSTFGRNSESNNTLSLPILKGSNNYHINASLIDETISVLKTAFNAPETLTRVFVMKHIQEPDFVWNENQLEQACQLSKGIDLMENTIKKDVLYYAGYDNSSERTICLDNVSFDGDTIKSIDVNVNNFNCETPQEFNAHYVNNFMFNLRQQIAIDYLYGHFYRIHEESFNPNNNGDLVDFIEECNSDLDLSDNMSIHDNISFRILKLMSEHDAFKNNPEAFKNAVQSFSLLTSQVEDDNDAFLTVEFAVNDNLKINSEFNKLKIFMEDLDYVQKELSKSFKQNGLSI